MLTEGKNHRGRKRSKPESSEGGEVSRKQNVIPFLRQMPRSRGVWDVKCTFPPLQPALLSFLLPLILAPSFPPKQVWNTVREKPNRGTEIWRRTNSRVLWSRQDQKDVPWRIVSVQSLTINYEQRVSWLYPERLDISSYRGGSWGTSWKMPGEERGAFQKHETAGAPETGCPTATCVRMGEKKSGKPGEGSRRGISMEGLWFTGRSLNFILWAVSRDGWNCPANTSKVTHLPLRPLASKSRGIFSPSQDSLFLPHRRCQRQRLLI